MTNMKLADVKKAVKSCDRVYGYVKLNDYDGYYVQLMKGDLSYLLKNRPTDEPIFAHVTNNDLYIN